MTLRRRIRRHLSRGLLVGFVLLVVGLLLVPKLVPAEKWKQIALDRIEAESGLVVRAEGAELSFPWPLGLRLTGLSVDDPQLRSGMRELHATARAVVVRARLAPLFRGEFEAEELSVEDLGARWVSPAGAPITLQGISARGRMQASSEGSIAKLQLDQVEGLGLSGKGTVDWSAVSRRAEFEFALRAKLPELYDQVLASGVAGKLDFDPATVAAPKGHAQSDLRGEWKQTSEKDWTVDLRLEDGRLEELVFELPEDGGQLSGSTTWTARYRVDSASLSADQPGKVDYEVAASGLALRPQGWAEDLTASAGRVRGNLDRVSVQGLRFSGAGIDGGVADLVTVGLATVPQTTGKVKAERLDLQTLQRVSGVVDARGDSPGWVLTDLEGRAQFVDQQLQLDEIVARVAGGELRAALDVNYGADPPTWVGRIDAAAVGAQAMLEPMVPSVARALEALLSGELSMSGVISEEPAQSLSALAGKVVLFCDEGRLATTPLLGERVAQFLGPHAESWRELRFRALDAALRVDDGRVYFDRVFLRGDTEVALAGSVGLDGSNAYRLDIRLPVGTTPQLGALEPLAELLRDEDGRFAFGVNVRGRAARPKVEIDFASLEARAREAGEAAAKDRLEDALEGLGSKLFGGKKQ
jgi:AsmA-like C-terminal region